MFPGGLDALLTVRWVCWGVGVIRDWIALKLSKLQYRIALHRWAWLHFLFVAVFLCVEGLLPVVILPDAAYAQDLPAAASSTPQGVVTTTMNVNGTNVAVPDWSKTTFNNLPGMLEGGSVQVPPDIASQLGGFNPSLTWKAGDQVSNVLKMGHVQSLGGQNLNLQQIAQASGSTQSLATEALNAFQPTASQSLASMTQAIPSLNFKKVSEVLPINDLISTATGALITPVLGDGTVAQAAQMLIGDLISFNPDLGQLQFNQLDLTKYALAAIPGLDATPIKAFLDWQSADLSGIPGLADVPLDALSALGGNPLDVISQLTSIIAVVDVPLDELEQNRTRTVSGSYKAGFEVACTTNCAHAELTPVGGSQASLTIPGAAAATNALDSAAGTATGVANVVPGGGQVSGAIGGAVDAVKDLIPDPVNGKAWISGKFQLVPGGFGVLSALSLGMEPTGRNPFGSVFKQVVWNVDQAKGQVDTVMFFRICHRGIPDLGCSPYIFGPIPFIPYTEKMPIFLGIATDDDGKGVDLFDQSKSHKGRGTTRNCGGGLAGDAVDKAIAEVPQDQQEYAKDSIPLLLAAAQEEGVTDPLQVGYILSTAQQEATFGAAMEEDSGTRYQSDSDGYHGRGYGLTGIDNYRKAGEHFGVDLVNHPELAGEPELAAKILVWGMKEGVFTGTSLDSTIPVGGNADLIEARAIMNPGEIGLNGVPEKMAEDAKRYANAIQGTDLNELQKKKGCSSGQSGEGGWFDPLPGGTQTHPFGEFPHGDPPHVHQGIDISLGQDRVPVYAAHDGVVTDVISGCLDIEVYDDAGMYHKSADYGCGGGYGNLVQIDHDGGYQTMYGHNYEATVSVGQQVKGGEQIALQGSTGGSTGSHSHFEVRLDGERISPASVPVPNMQS